MKTLFKPVSWLVAIIFLIEEAIWNWTSAQMQKLGAVRIIAFIEDQIRKLPPYPALIAFLLPDLIVVPAKFLGMHFISSGHLFIGVSVFVVAKFVGMALFARIFTLTKPALMQLAWFVKVHAKVVGYSERIHAFLANWPFYQSAKRQMKRVTRIFRVFVVKKKQPA